MNIDNKVIANLRADYKARTLDIEEIDANPIKQFHIWFQEAMQSAIKEPNIMTVATVDAQGKPSARILLLKGFDESGFVFYTNYESKKGQEIAENPNVALVFMWLELERQVRIEGVARKVSAEQSRQYFQSRPKGSQIGAWASPQSQVISKRSILEEKVKTLQSQYKNEEYLPLPSHWGGYKVQANLIEFWQGRSSRLHDRICYTLEDNKWKIERLAP